MNLALYGIPLAALVIGIVQVAKESGLPSRLAPVVSLAVGVLAGIALQLSQIHPDYLQGVVVGTAIGLAASGLYSGVSAFVAPATLTAIAGDIKPAQPAAPADPAPADAPKN